VGGERRLVLNKQRVKWMGEVKSPDVESPGGRSGGRPRFGSQGQARRNQSLGLESRCQIFAEASREDDAPGLSITGSPSSRAGPRVRRGRGEIENREIDLPIVARGSRLVGRGSLVAARWSRR
jgi:hypothetical protein